MKILDPNIPNANPDGTYKNYVSEEEQGTLFVAEVMNSLGLELTNILTQAGLIPSYDNNTQIYTAIKKFYTDADNQVKLYLTKYVDEKVKTKAKDITLDKITELSATNVQDAVNELLTKITANVKAIQGKVDKDFFSNYQQEISNKLTKKADKTQLNNYITTNTFNTEKTKLQQSIDLKEDKANLTTVAKTDEANNFTQTNTFNSVVVETPASINENPIRKQEFDVEVANINQKINSISGGTVFIGVIDKSVSEIDSNKQLLTDYVQQQASRPPRKGDMVNSNDHSTFIYTGEEWVYMGNTSIGVATTSSLGLIKAEADEGGAINVSPDGKATVNKFNTKLNKSNVVNEENNTTSNVYCTSYIETNFAKKTDLTDKINREEFTQLEEKVNTNTTNIDERVLTTEFEEFKNSNIEALRLKADVSTVEALEKRVQANSENIETKVSREDYDALNSIVDQNTLDIITVKSTADDADLLSKKNAGELKTLEESVGTKANDSEVVKNTGQQKITGSLELTRNIGGGLGALNISSKAGFISFTDTDNQRLAYIGFQSGSAPDLRIDVSKFEGRYGDIVSQQKFKYLSNVSNITDNNDLTTKEYVDNKVKEINSIEIVQGITTDTDKVPSCNAVNNAIDNLRAKYIATDNLKKEYSENADAVYNTVFFNNYGGLVNGSVGRDLKVLFNTRDVKTVFLRLKEIAQSPHPNRFANLRIGDYIDLDNFNDGEVDVNNNPEQENLRIEIVAFDHYLGYKELATHHIVMQFKNCYRLFKDADNQLTYDYGKSKLFTFLNKNVFNAIQNTTGITPIEIQRNTFKYEDGSDNEGSFYWLAEKVFLPHEAEMIGYRCVCNPVATAKYKTFAQGTARQFPLYALNNSSLMKKNADKYTTWWGSSVSTVEKGCFVCMMNDGSIWDRYTNLDNGLAPIFCVG